MNLIKKEDPLNLITDISPKFYEEIIEKSPVFTLISAEYGLLID